MVLLPSSIGGQSPINDQPTGVFIGLGSNLDHQNLSPRQTIERGLYLLGKGGDSIVATSSLWTSKAWPEGTKASDYINAVCQVTPWDSDPAALLQRLHAIEAELGRQRDPSNRWAERTLDLDLIDYNGMILENDSVLTLPHPRIAVRDFVLLPLLEVSPNWVHPQTGIEAQKLLERIYQTHGDTQCHRIVGEP
jgi:2-amino-4-hydroxy-6-hydroxymethyldihydropteridine diphosphokinase